MSSRKRSDMPTTSSPSSSSSSSGATSPEKKHRSETLDLGEFTVVGLPWCLAKNETQVMHLIAHNNKVYFSKKNLEQILGINSKGSMIFHGTTEKKVSKEFDLVACRRNNATLLGSSSVQFILPASIVKEALETLPDDSKGKTNWNERRNTLRMFDLFLDHCTISSSSDKKIVYDGKGDYVVEQQYYGGGVTEPTDVPALVPPTPLPASTPVTRRSQTRVAPSSLSDPVGPSSSSPVPATIPLLSLSSHPLARVITPTIALQYMICHEYVMNCIPPGAERDRYSAMHHKVVLPIIQTLI